MDIENIQKLLQIKKKGEASKADKKSFNDDWIAYVDINGFDDMAESFLYDGFSFMGILPFISYLEKVSDKNEAVKKLLAGKSYYKNKSMTFKLMLHMLAIFIKMWPSELTVISSVINRLPALSVNKENKQLGDITKSIYKYFIQVLSPESTLPPIEGLRSMNKDPFRSMMADSLGTLVAEGHCSISELATMNKIGYWLNVNKVADDISISDSLHATSCEPSSVSHVNKSDNTIMPAEKAKDSSISENEKTQTWRDNLNSIIVSAKKLDKIFLQLHEDNVRLLGENTKLKTECDNTHAVLKSERESCEHQRDEINCLAAEISSLRQQIITLEKIIGEKEAKIGEYGKLTDMLNKDRAKQSEEAFNRLASKIRVDYRDFLGSSNLPMTTDLGEIMRYQLKSIFDLLKKNGLNLE